MKIEIIILAWNNGLLSTKACLPKLFKILIIGGERQKGNPLDALLSDALVDWDFQEDLDFIERDLYLRFEMIFREYLRGAKDLSLVLNWKYEPRS